MTKTEKMLYRNHRGVRKSLLATEAAKRAPKYRGFMLMHTVEKPEFVVRTDGVRVEYTGP